MPAVAAEVLGALLPEPGSACRHLQQLTGAGCQLAPQPPELASLSSSDSPFPLHPTLELPVDSAQNIVIVSLKGPV